MGKARGDSCPSQNNFKNFFTFPKSSDSLNEDPLPPNKNSGATPLVVRQAWNQELSRVVFFISVHRNYFDGLRPMETDRDSKKNGINKEGKILLDLRFSR